jgi:hypothetical protein
MHWSKRIEQKRESDFDFLIKDNEQATIRSSFHRLHFTKLSASFYDLNHFELHCTNKVRLRLDRKLEVLYVI